MFIDPMRDGAALRQEGHIGFYVASFIGLTWPS
jgi:hypothetical protein